MTADVWALSSPELKIKKVPNSYVVKATGLGHLFLLSRSEKKEDTQF
jgi:hypothetical protein